MKSVLKFSERNVVLMLGLLQKDLVKAKTFKQKTDLNFMIRAFEDYKEHWWQK